MISVFYNEKISRAFNGRNEKSLFYDDNIVFFDIDDLQSGCEYFFSLNFFGNTPSLVAPRRDDISIHESMLYYCS